jgi:hypothetical protein
VVCKGQLGSDGQLEVASGGVMAKCPSKYDAKSPDYKGPAPGAPGSAPLAEKR